MALRRPLHDKQTLENWLRKYPKEEKARRERWAESLAVYDALGPEVTTPEQAAEKLDDIENTSGESTADGGSARTGRSPAALWMQSELVNIGL